jgi:hypothetical protein
MMGTRWRSRKWGLPYRPGIMPRMDSPIYAAFDAKMAEDNRGCLRFAGGTYCSGLNAK